MVDTSNLTATGEDLSGFFSALGPGVTDLVLTLGIIGGIVGLLAAVVYVIKKKVNI